MIIFFSVRNHKGDTSHSFPSPWPNRLLPCQLTRRLALYLLWSIGSSTAIYLDSICTYVHNVTYRYSYRSTKTQEDLGAPRTNEPRTNIATGCALFTSLSVKKFATYLPKAIFIPPYSQRRGAELAARRCTVVALRAQKVRRGIGTVHGKFLACDIRVHSSAGLRQEGRLVKARDQIYRRRGARASLSVRGCRALLGDCDFIG